MANESILAGKRVYVAGHGGMVGSAINLTDGRVDVRTSGTPEQLDRFEEALWRGPILAHVTDIDVRDEA